MPWKNLDKGRPTDEKYDSGEKARKEDGIGRREEMEDLAESLKLEAIKGEGIIGVYTRKKAVVGIG